MIGQGGLCIKSEYIRIKISSIYLYKPEVKRFHKSKENNIHHTRDITVFGFRIQNLDTVTLFGF